jgi:hypothetical protein
MIDSVGGKCEVADDLKSSTAKATFEGGEFVFTHHYTTSGIISDDYMVVLTPDGTEEFRVPMIIFSAMNAMLSRASEEQQRLSDRRTQRNELDIQKRNSAPPEPTPVSEIDLASMSDAEKQALMGRLLSASYHRN